MTNAIGAAPAAAVLPDVMSHLLAQRKQERTR
jgi:hypothetical protein